MYYAYSCYAGENVCDFEFDTAEELNEFLKNECFKDNCGYWYAGHLLKIHKK